MPVSRQTINAIENNKYDPTLTLAFHLAGVLGTTVDRLFLGPGKILLEVAGTRLQNGSPAVLCFRKDFLWNRWEVRK